MIRCSKLNEAADCGLSASIETRTTTVYAMRGDAFHAGNAAHHRPGEQRFADARAVAFGVLGVDDAAEVTHMLQDFWPYWTPPADAEFEVSVAMDRNGIRVPLDSEEAITQGTADCVWTEGEYLVVVDFKSGARAEWNVPLPGENLQLLAYGFALADAMGKTKVKLGIYRGAAEPAYRWVWDEIDLDTAEATKLWERVRGAALHDPEEAVTGPHCNDCFVRLQCPAHLLPAVSEVDRESAFAVMSAPLEGPIEPAKMLRLLNAVKALEDLAEAGKDFAKAHADAYGPVEVNGKQWGPNPVKGRELVSIKSLQETGLYDQARKLGAIRDGAPTQAYKWTNVKGGKAA